MEEFLQVGVITATHGIHGEVKVFPTTDDPKRFKKLKKVLLDTGREKLELEVEGVKFFKNMVKNIMISIRLKNTESVRCL